MSGNDAAYNAIKRKYAGMEQDALPIVLPAATGGGARDAERKQRAPASVRFATCPQCMGDRATGVIRLRDGTEVFRGHNRVMHSGRRTPCPGAGQVAPPDPHA